jgi:hypothetical protein
MFIQPKQQLDRIPDLLLVIGKKDALPNGLALFAHKSMACLGFESQRLMRWGAGAIGVWLKRIQGTCRGESSGFLRRTAPG